MLASEVKIAMFNRQLRDLIGQNLAINLMEDLMHNQLLIADGKMVIEMISDQIPKLIEINLIGRQMCMKNRT